MRQNIIGLERKCLAKDFWFCLLATTTRSSVVDTYRWYRNMKFKGATNALMRRRQCETNNFETECDYEIEVTKLTGMLSKSLEDDVRKQHAPRHSHISA